MAIQTINFNNYKRYFGKNSKEHEKIKQKLTPVIREKLVNLNATMIELYNFNEERQNFRAGSKDRITIFCNATKEGIDEVINLEEPIKINNIENNFKHFLSPSGNGLSILSEDGTVIAEWLEETFELNILFSIFDEYSNASIEIFKFIMSEFERLVWFPKTLENSWKHTNNKDKLINTFKDISTRRKKEILAEDKRQLARYERDLNDYRRQIKNISDNLIQRRKQIEQNETSLNNLSDNIIKDFDLIIENKKIKDLQIKDNKFIIFTNPLYIHSDKGYKYYGGNYRIELNPENSDVYFFGDNPRYSYWTDHDPHPHVNGRSGEACLGNVSSTIAELCSQMQIYALVMVCIDFLEAANTGDPAGKNIINWDLVDDEGNIIKEEKREDIQEDTIVCQLCGNRTHTDEIYTVYEDIEHEYNEDDEPTGNYTLGEERQVCEDCFEEHYYHDEISEEYIRS